MVSQSNKAPAYNAVLWTLFGLVVVSIFTRVIGRTSLAKEKRNRLWVEDWLVLISLIIDVLSVSLFSVSMDKGMGRHIAALEAEDPMSIPTAIKYGYIAITLGFFAGTLAKFAIVFLLVRIFEPRRMVAITMFAMEIVQLLCVVVDVSLNFTACTPRQKVFNALVPGKCMNPKISEDFAIAGSAWAAMTDLVLAIYPVVVVSKLHMQRSKKLGISAVMAAGALTCFTEVYTITLLKYIANQSDYTWNAVDLQFWTLLQVHIVIIACCIPTMLPFAKWVRSESRTLWSRTMSSLTKIVGSVKQSATSGSSDELHLIRGTAGENLRLHQEHAAKPLESIQNYPLSPSNRSLMKKWLLATSMATTRIGRQVILDRPVYGRLQDDELIMG